MQKIERFDKTNFVALCQELAERDNDLKNILLEYGYPPMWIRSNSFETLVLTILEQQVSLASAFAAFKKLKEKLVKITPGRLLSLSDAELRQCYFSRQKTEYVRILARAMEAKEINLKAFEAEKDDMIRAKLTALKGIGDWTVDIYLLHALQRTDIFPVGDLALVKAIQMIRGKPAYPKTEVIKMGEPWKPYRSIATMLLWHYYIKKKNFTVIH